MLHVAHWTLYLWITCPLFCSVLRALLITQSTWMLCLSSSPTPSVKEVSRQYLHYIPVPAPFTLILLITILTPLIGSPHVHCTELKVAVVQDPNIDKKHSRANRFLVCVCSRRCEKACDASNNQPTLTAMQSNKFRSNSEHQHLAWREQSLCLCICWTVAGNGEYTANNKSVHLFAAKVGHSYSCKGESLYMGNGLFLDVNQDRMQAFNLTKSNEFGLRKCLREKTIHQGAFFTQGELLIHACSCLLHTLLDPSKSYSILNMKESLIIISH